MNSLTADFISEARELLEASNTNLLALEGDPNNAETINTLFRAIHTLKGNSGLVGLMQMTRLLHAAEDVMDAIRQHALTFDSDIIDTLLDVADRVSSWIDQFQASGNLPEDAESKASPLISRLQSFFSHEGNIDGASEDKKNPIMPQPCSWLDLVPLDTRIALLRETTDSGKQLFAIAYYPAEDCFFRGEDPLFLVQKIEDVRWRSVVMPANLPSLDSFDAYACVMSFRCLAVSTREELERVFSYVLPQVQITVLESMAAIAGRASDSSVLLEQSLTEEDRSALDRLWRQLDISIQTAGDNDVLHGRLRSTAAILRTSATRLGGGELQSGIDDALRIALETCDSMPLHVAIAGLLAKLNGEGPAVVDAVEPGPVTTNIVPEQEGAGRQKSGVRHVLKVDQARVDRLMDLIAELVVAKNSLPYLADRATAVFGVRELSRDIKDHFSVVNRITQDLQDTIMAVRMLPVSQAFQRFPRLVRDVARKLNKNVGLVLEGEDTEMDKDIVEALGDPLMHIIRNSLDHGIEKLQDRLAASKPAHGTIHIKASQENGRALIEIRDDGAGIDPERIKRKALERGLLGLDEIATLSDHDAIQLVFRAGFSTVEQVSDLSGRGVGMDVVRSAVEQIGGSVQLNSVKGEGTQIVLSLPMTMTSTRAMVVKADNQSFGVPLDIVFETFRAPQDSIFRIKQKEVLVRRDRTIPVVRLRTLLELPPPKAMESGEEYAILMTRIRGENAALIIDDFDEIVEVIMKPMEGVISGAKGLTSTAILGDGTILLMIDLEGLL